MKPVFIFFFGVLLGALIREVEKRITHEKEE